MKTKYFLCKFNSTNSLRKLSEGRLYWYYPRLGLWIDLHINDPEAMKYYTEITEEEAFRHLLEN